jgi:predicted RNA binding protein YcfA (HicA-like mRNA interferase family)
MKLPRTVSGEHLIAILGKLGYQRVRQKGSHVRVRHDGPPTHSVTIPLHNTLKAGTLHGILSEVAAMRSMPLEDIVNLL